MKTKKQNVEKMALADDEVIRNLIHGLEGHDQLAVVVMLVSGRRAVDISRIDSNSVIFTDGVWYLAGS